jgi:hypothetical protein
MFTDNRTLINYLYKIGKVLFDCSLVVGGIPLPSTNCLLIVSKQNAQSHKLLRKKKVQRNYLSINFNKTK